MVESQYLRNPVCEGVDVIDINQNPVISGYHRLHRGKIDALAPAGRNPDITLRVKTPNSSPLPISSRAMHIEVTLDCVDYCVDLRVRDAVIIW